jgi:hypothetical protein
MISFFFYEKIIVYIMRSSKEASRDLPLCTCIIDFGKAIKTVVKSSFISRT